MLNSFQHLVVCCYISAVAQGGGPQAGEPVTLPVKEVFAVYPNPMKATVRVEYGLKTPGVVGLSVFDITGRLVRTLVNGEQPAGVHCTIWDGKTQSGEPVPNGIYMLKLNAPDVSKTAKVIALR